jgi:UDP-N-acetylglucosamine kinase
VDQYFAARKVVDALKVKFGQAIKIDLLLKDTDGSRRQYCANVDRIENYVPEKYTREDVEKLVR